MPISSRVLGKTGMKASMLGLGGNRLLATPGRLDDARALIHRALELGITYFDTARLYPESEVYLGRALGARRDGVFLATKTHARDARGAAAHLHESLERLRTDHVDLWQLHDLRSQDDVEQVCAPGGALEALRAAQLAGKCRLLGVTGHRAPDVIQQCMARFDFDVILVPTNPAEPHFRSFLDSAVPDAVRMGVAVVGMYLYCGGRIAALPHFEGATPYVHFALSQNVSVALVGCDSVQQLEDNVEAARRFVPMSDADQRALVERLEPDAHSLMYYKR